MWQSDVAYFIGKAGLDRHKSPGCELQVPEGIRASHNSSTAKILEDLTACYLLLLLSVDMQAEFVLLCIFAYSDTQKKEGLG